MSDITRIARGGAGPRRTFIAALLVVLLGVALGAVAANFAASGMAPATSVPTAIETIASANKPAPTATQPDPAPAALPAGTRTPTSGTPSATPTPDADGRFALLLLGYGGGGHDGSLLTDAMMVVIGDTEKKTLALLSLPRDIWAPLALGGSTTYAKLNTAYAEATLVRPSPTPGSRWTLGPTEDHFPGRFTRQTVESMLGIQLDYYAALDFQGFREAIDAVGGIDVDVPNGFTAQYPRDDNPRIDPGWKIVSFAAGPQRMDGDRALVYTRARLTLDNSGEGSDFARALRQRIVLNAFKDRLLTASGLTRLPTLLTIANQRTITDYPIPAAADLAKLLVSAREVEIYQATLGLDNYLVEGTGPQGAYILVPDTTDGSWAQVRAFARRFRDDPASAEVIAAHRLNIVDRSGTYGLGERVARRLTALGYPVGYVSVGAERVTSALLVRGGDDSAAKMLATALAGDLKLESLAGQAEEARSSSRASATLELGADAALAVTDLPLGDTNAPKSAYGVENRGAWVPAALPTDIPLPTISTPTGTVASTPAPGQTTAVSGTPIATSAPATATTRPAGPQLPVAPTATPVPPAPTQPSAATKAPTQPPATVAPAPTTPPKLPTPRPPPPLPTFPRR